MNSQHAARFDFSFNKYGDKGALLVEVPKNWDGTVPVLAVLKVFKGIWNSVGAVPTSMENQGLLRLACSASGLDGLKFKSAWVPDGMGNADRQIVIPASELQKLMAIAPAHAQA